MSKGIILEHLNIYAGFHRQRPWPGEIKRSFATLLLEHGREYQTDEHSFVGRRMQKKMCYRNAALRVIEDNSLTYVEGYTTSLGFIPIEHAWYVGPSGMVVDPTLRDDDDEREYFGVGFTTDFLRSEILRRKVWGLLDMNRELLTMSEEELLKVLVK